MDGEWEGWGGYLKSDDVNVYFKDEIKICGLCVCFHEHDLIFKTS